MLAKTAQRLRLPTLFLWFKPEYQHLSEVSCMRIVIAQSAATPMRGWMLRSSAWLMPVTGSVWSSSRTVVAPTAWCRLVADCSTTLAGGVRQPG